MAVLVGIDEAGFGPILGPLVVSSSTFLLPGNLVGADLWKILVKSVASQKKRQAGRLLVADSKKFHNSSERIKLLERTVLAALYYLGKKPATLTELIAMLCPDSLERLEIYPWHKSKSSSRLLVNHADLTIASKVFSEDMAANGIQLLELKSCCLDVAHYNKLVGDVKNKSVVLFTVVCQHIKEAFDKFGGDDLQILVDRQGGRVRYQRILQRMFPGMDLRILKESEANSSYELKADGKKMRLHFAIKADNKFLPVSLASMVSKYLRELLMHNINRYFAGFHADLRPTAGYWKDGLRFIEDLKKNRTGLAYDKDKLIRCR